MPDFEDVKNSVYSINCGEYDRILIIGGIESFSNEVFFDIFDRLGKFEKS